MYDYSKQITAYHDEKINLPEKVREKLRGHRTANQDRIIRNIRDGVSVGKSSFVKQGSYAMLTTIQHPENDYDIDDGLMMKKEELLGERGAEMSALQVRQMVLEAVKDDKFKQEPECLKNCVRVYYQEGHHVDIPCYRTYTNDSGNEVVELASSDWKVSNPKEINRWFGDSVTSFNNTREGRGLQFRRMIRLIKRFARSRASWNMPSGLILTMLVSEKIPNYERDDECFYYLLSNLGPRLSGNLIVENLADSSYPKEQLTKSNEDASMVELRNRIDEALKELRVLHDYDCTKKAARKAWDAVFKTDGFFDDFDRDEDNGGGNGGGKSPVTNVASSKPDKPVDLQGGGRFGIL
jgi:hypothetical protein